MDIMDVFRNDAFTALSLTSAVEKRPYNPIGIGQLGIFDPLPIRTTALAVEERNGVLVLIPTSPRGAPATERVTERRKARFFEAPRLFHGDTIKASELQNVREFIGDGGMAVTTLMQMQQEVARRLSGPTGLQASMEYTWEYHRLGAVQGILSDADGSPLFNWFDEFGITPPTEVAFNLAAGAAAETGTLRGQINTIVRGMARAAQGAFTPNTRVIGMCGDTFYDEFTNHKDVVRTFQNWAEAVDLRSGVAAAPNAAGNFGAFQFGGITWINYRGSDDASTISITTDKVKFFPVNAPGIFQVAWAPGEAAQWVNQPGKPLYVQPIPDKDRNEWFRLEVKSYPLHICTRPAVLYSGRAGS